MLGACILTIWIVWSREEWMSESMLQLAEKKWQSEDYLGAVHEYERLVQSYPKSPLVPEAYYWKGVALSIYLDNPKDAANTLQKVTQLTIPSDEGSYKLKAHRSLAEIYEKKLKRTNDAIAVYEGIIELSSDPEEALRSRYKIGELYYAMGDLVQARVEWDLLSMKDPRSHWAPAALYRKGGTYFVTGDCKKAVEVYKVLYTDYPEDKMSHFAKFRAANCLEMEKQAAEAYDLYKELKGNYPDQALITRKMKTLEPHFQDKLGRL